MSINLPTDLLRSLVAIVDAGSMVKAAERVNLTQSALSLQMKRLADMVEAPIFARHRRGLSLTPTGDTLMPFARGMLDLNDRAIATINRDAHADPIRFGIVQDFAADMLSGLLIRFLAQYPDARLQMKVGLSASLNAQFEAGLLDIVLTIGKPDEPGAIATTDMIWCGSPALAESAEIPLAIMEAPCAFREGALANLHRAGRPYRIVLETPSVAVLKAAVEANLALTCRTNGFIDDARPLDLTAHPLPEIGYVLRTSDDGRPLVLRLSTLIRGCVLERHRCGAGPEEDALRRKRKHPAPPRGGEEFRAPPSGTGQPGRP